MDGGHRHRAAGAKPARQHDLTRDRIVRGTKGAKPTLGGPKTNLIRKIEVAIYRLTATEPQSWRENPGLRGIALGLEPGREEMSARAKTAGIPDIATLVDAPRLLATMVPIEPCTYKAVGALQKVEQRRLAAMGEREGGEG